MTTDRAALDAFATHFLDSYHETAVISRRFAADYGIPPTLLAKAHVLRSVVQARLTTDGNFELLQRFSEFGRVHFVDSLDNEFVLRSASALVIENDFASPQKEQLFDVEKLRSVSPAQLLVYRFAPEGLHLSTCATRKIPKKSKYLAVGALTYQGLWPNHGDGGGDGGTFSQDGPDDFGDVGEIDLGETDEGAGE